MSAQTWTFSTLKTALQEWNENDDTDFTDQLGDIINLAEERCWKVLPLTIFDQTSTSATTSAGTKTITRPADALKINEVYVDGTFLEPRTVEFCRWWASLNSNTVPAFWAEDSETTILLSPIPGGTYPTEVEFIQRPTPLSDANTSNWLAEHQGDLLFAAASLEAQIYLKAYEEIQIWQQAFNEKAVAVQQELASVRRRDYRPSMTSTG